MRLAHSKTRILAACARHPCLWSMSGFRTPTCINTGSSGPTKAVRLITQGPGPNLIMRGGPSVIVRLVLYHLQDQSSKSANGATRILRTAKRSRVRADRTLMLHRKNCTLWLRNISDRRPRHRCRIPLHQRSGRHRHPATIGRRDRAASRRANPPGAGARGIRRSPRVV